MDFSQTLILVPVQGITEFLLIFSSAHLILVPALAGRKDQGLVFDGATWRQAAARLSFPLSPPTLLASGVLFTRDLLEGTEPVDLGVRPLGSALAAISATGASDAIRLLERTGMMPRVVYRLLLGPCC